MLATLVATEARTVRVEGTLGGCGNIGPADVPAAIGGASEIASEIASEDCTVDRVGALLI